MKARLVMYRASLRRCSTVPVLVKLHFLTCHSVLDSSVKKFWISSAHGVARVDAIMKGTNKECALYV